jgi:heterodisulfide reductase subunit A
MMGKNNIEFIRYARDTPPVTDPQSSGDIAVSVIDADSREEKHIQADLVVLTTPLEAPEEQSGLKEMLGVCQDPNGFLMGALGKLRPLDFTADGIFLCGTAHSPKGLSEVIADGEGAASRVATVISHHILEKEPVTSYVVDENCDGCAYCIEPCVFNALTLLEYMRNGEIKKTVETNETLCKGCGVCMATCPKQGIYVRHYRPEHFNAMIHAALEDVALEDAASEVEE